MPFNIGPLELAILLVIVLMFFGAGKLSKAGESLGKGIKDFRGSIQEQDEEKDD